DAVDDGRDRAVVREGVCFDPLHPPQPGDGDGFARLQRGIVWRGAGLGGKLLERLVRIARAYVHVHLEPAVGQPVAAVIERPVVADDDFGLSVGIVVEIAVLPDEPAARTVEAEAARFETTGTAGNSRLGRGGRCGWGRRFRWSGGLGGGKSSRRPAAVTVRFRRAERPERTTVER